MSAEGSHRPLKPGDHVYLIDGSGYVFRAYHALPPLTRKSDGLPTGAVAGFSNMMWKLLADTKAGDKPTHLAVIFDAGSQTFRNDMYAEYKANREAPPEDLIPQFPLTRESTRAFGVPSIEKDGFEADDLIATYARVAREAGAKVTIVSSDKDLMQLVRGGVVDMLDTMKNKRIGPAEVMERFGVPPEKVIDVQALIGDPIDNVPGIRGIGVKTAAKLISEFGDLETLLARAGEVKQEKCRLSLIEGADIARLSAKLVTLDEHVPLDTDVADFGVREPDANVLLPFLQKMEFSTLTKRVATALGLEDFELAPRPPPAPRAEASAAIPAGGKGVPGTVAGRAAAMSPIDHARYETVTDLAALERWVAAARDSGLVGIALERAATDTGHGELVGIALALSPLHVAYIPVGHGGNAAGSLELSARPTQLAEKDVMARLKPLLEDESALKVGHNIKFAARMLLERGIKLTAADDVMLLSYVLEAGLHGYRLEELAEVHLGLRAIDLADLLGKGREKLTLTTLPMADAARYVGERADLALRLFAIIKPALIAAKRMTVYETLERPLIPVIARMECAGIRVDPGFLAKLSNDFAKEMARLETEIHALAGEKFNLGSPKQLGDILFGKLSLPGGRKTKTGAWSTDADILEELALTHDMPARILEWRQLSKLKSTYTDSLPLHIDAKTNRVHTTFQFAATTTGRISSIDPNLQNIPIRTSAGRQLRRAFIAAPGKRLISADYSQIELRLLAHVAEVPALRQAFTDGTDIHAMTASEMFNVPVKGMPPEVRSRAKAINFGIIYGISAFGLANQLGIGRGEADSYIKKYFERFPGIRDYMETTRLFAREHGYVETIFGRRIHIRDSKSSNPAQRAAGDRQAINAPIQGSAADVIRRAMVRLPEAMAAKNLDAELLLQVHDELVIEASERDMDAVCALARDIMEKAPLPAVQLRVKLVVDARAGLNWDEAH